MKNKVIFFGLVLIDIACAIGAGVTSDMKLTNTSQALAGVIGVLTPLLVLWLIFGDLSDSR